ncbi:MAG: 4-(cytidine 5'-diphospho)-2-C-methyl-D-erythritol kinase [Acidobacteriota bacterium]
MPESIVVPAFAKINWLLHVFGLRADGYHELETIFQSIALYDVVTLSRSDDLALNCDAAGVPGGAANLAWKAAAAMMAAFNLPAVRIDLEKHIPAAGGLGGGSADAAAVIRGMAALYELRDEPLKLAEVALSIGSDVPFFLVGGTAHASGRGEVLTPLPDLPSVPLLLIVPEERVSTAIAFEGLRDARRETAAPAPEILGSGAARALTSENILEHAPELTNDLESIVFAMHPHFADLRQALLESGATWAAMSGSGSTIVGAYSEESLRDAAIERFGTSAIISRTISRAESLQFRS